MHIPFLNTRTKLVETWTSNIDLSEWYLNHRITITLHASIIRKLNKTIHSSACSVTENSKKTFPKSTNINRPSTECRMIQEDIVIVEIKAICGYTVL